MDTEKKDFLNERQEEDFMGSTKTRLSFSFIEEHRSLLPLECTKAVKTEGWVTQQRHANRLLRKKKTELEHAYS